MIGSGFSAQTVPTARDAPGWPDSSATCEYVRVSPYGMREMADRTSLRNSVPSTRVSTSKSLMAPDR